jgi:tetratricopeptide (TPR) repeat protein
MGAQVVLRRNPDHIPALKAKAVIHARAELLYYNANLAYSLAARVAKLQPSANEYLLSLTDWLSGEVRFTVESGHRVPHDPLLGLDRSIELLDSVIDSSVPYSNEEGMAFYQMARTLAKRGRFKESIEYFQLALSRPVMAGGRQEILREMSISYFRAGDFAEAARNLYRALTLSNNVVDQWLLKVALDRWEGSSIRLPDSMAFPVIEAKVDPQKPPLLSFTDMAPELGVNRKDGNGTCAFGDFSGDGKRTRCLRAAERFWPRINGRMERFGVTGAVGLASAIAYSLNLVDYDNDGRLDCSCH